MRNEETMLTYDSETACLGQIERCLKDWGGAQAIAEAGRRRISEIYSKERQLSCFEAIVARL